MFKSLVGSKVGMTQLFDKDKRRVVPVTAVKIERLYVTQVKSIDRDGYVAVQVGMPKDRYLDSTLSEDWLKKKSKYFKVVKEIDFINKDVKAGDPLTLEDFGVKEGTSVKVSGKSKGLGFLGVMGRWGFSGGPKSHGSTFHRAPGSIGSIRMVGEVWKGKKLPGRTGSDQVSVRSVVEKIDNQAGILFLRGSVPGKSGFLLEVFAR